MKVIKLGEQQAIHESKRRTPHQSAPASKHSLPPSALSVSPCEASSQAPSTEPPEKKDVKGTPLAPTYQFYILAFSIHCLQISLLLFYFYIQINKQIILQSPMLCVPTEYQFTAIIDNITPRWDSFAPIGGTIDSIGSTIGAIGGTIDPIGSTIRAILCVIRAVGLSAALNKYQNVSLGGMYGTKK
jgi:hypothetical protein